LGSQAFASGVVLLATIVAAYVRTLNSAAPRHMCTVTEARILHRHSPGLAETARITVTGALSGSAANRFLVLRGRLSAEFPIAVAFYDRHGNILD
jgi:hypothetical protein